MPRLAARGPFRSARSSRALPHGSACRGRGTWAAVLIVTLALAVTAGCKPAAPVPHDPSIAGVVATRDFLASRTVRLVLATGESVDIDLATVRHLDPNAGDPDPGDLLLYGTEPDGPWLATAYPAVGGGFELQSQPRGIDPDGTILFESGLRLPIAGNFSVSVTGPMEAGAPVTYLLNENGEVTRLQ
jgi:hypothetical protein